MDQHRRAVGKVHPPLQVVGERPVVVLSVDVQQVERARPRLPGLRRVVADQFDRIRHAGHLDVSLEMRHASRCRRTSVRRRTGPWRRPRPRARAGHAASTTVERPWWLPISTATAAPAGSDPGLLVAAMRPAPLVNQPRNAVGKRPDFRETPIGGRRRGVRHVIPISRWRTATLARHIQQWNCTAAEGCTSAQSLRANADRLETRQSRRGRGPTLGVWILLLLGSLLQQPGRTTFDTKFDLTADPAAFLDRAPAPVEPVSPSAGCRTRPTATSSPRDRSSSARELLHVPDWVAQRLWSALLLVAAYEGTRRVAPRARESLRAPRVCGGLGYALAPRLLGAVGVLSR